MDYITVGEIVKAQGIFGEVKVRTLTSTSERFRKLRILYADNRPYKVLSCRIDRQYVYLRLQGIDDRNAAEAMRGKFLQIDRVHAVELEEDEYFIADLIGCSIVTETGKEIGTITDVSQNSGAVDVIHAMGVSGKELRFPFLNRVVSRVDIEQKKFIVFSALLDEVCVYDD